MRDARRHDETIAAAHDEPARPAPGRVTLTSRLAADGVAADGVAADGVAADGVAAAGEPLPFLSEIRTSFGRHADALDGARARTGGAATAASDTLGAEAYAYGDRVAFAQAPDRALAAHEAAHIVQQRAGATPGDAHERNADEVAAAVVAGRSAEPLLDGHAGAGGAPVVQRKEAAPDVPISRVIELIQATDRELSNEVWEVVGELGASHEHLADGTPFTAAASELRQTFDELRPELENDRALGYHDMTQALPFVGGARLVTPAVAASWSEALAEAGDNRIGLARLAEQSLTAEIGGLRNDLRVQREELHGHLAAVARLKAAAAESKDGREGIALVFDVYSGMQALESFAAVTDSMSMADFVARQVASKVGSVSGTIQAEIGAISDYYLSVGIIVEGYADIDELRTGIVGTVREIVELIETLDDRARRIVHAQHLLAVAPFRP